MTQGRTLKELEENLRDAYEMMVMADVPAERGLTMNDAASEIEKYVRTIRRRNILEIGVGLVMLWVFGRHLAAAPIGSLEFYGHALILAAIVFVICMVLFVASTRGNLKSHPADDFLFWRTEMRRQAKLLRRAPVWYIAPFLAGLALLLWPLFGLLLRPAVRFERIIAGAVLAFVTLVLVGIAWANVKAADKLERQADSIG
jgi:hypothetical protein